MRVLTKTACYIEGIWHGANTEIDIPDEHFAESVHTPLEDAPAAEPVIAYDDSGPVSPKGKSK
jgi:hypothetical protein